MTHFFIISGILGNDNDVSSNMILSLESSEIVFVEKKDNFLDFVNRLHLSFSGAIIEMDDEGLYLQKSKELIVSNILKGLHMSLFESSGTACFRDPGYDLLDFLYTLRTKVDFDICPIIGNGALQTAISVSGIFMDQYVFLDGIHQGIENDIEKYDIPVAYFNHIRDFDAFFKTLNFLHGKKDLRVFVGINLGKKGVPLSNFLLNGDGDYVLGNLKKTFLGLSSIPDMVIIFDKNYKENISIKKMRRNHNI